MRQPRVTIIIPLYKVTPYFYEAVEKCLSLDYQNFEILIGADKNIKLFYKDKKIRIIKTDSDRTGPAEKRDLAIKKATGDIIAFLDDDSYPADDWITKAVQLVNNEGVDVVCGPGLTPPGDNYWQKVTGAILSSKFGSGPYYYRFTKGSSRFVDDYPAYNLFAKKSVLDEVGGYGTKFYGGEDTALCIKIINSGHKILYHPDIVVYHHRRSFPLEYARQVGNVGKHRGFFVKKYPQTSLRVSYFAPAVFTVLLPVIFILSLLKIDIAVLVTFGFFVYFGTILIIEAEKNSLLVNLLLPFAMIVNQLAYGVKFIQGLLFTREIVR